MELVGKRVPLVLFSGGMDSAYLLHELLKRYKLVDVVASDLDSMPAVSQQQETARSRIFSTLQTLHANGEVLGRIRHVDSFRVPAKNNGRLGVNMTLGWVLTGISMLRMDTEDVYVGYVRGDNASRTASAFISTWDQALLASDIKKIEGVDFPRLQLPLVNTCKSDIILRIDPRIMKDVAWCDGGSTGMDCGLCWSCRGMGAATDKLRSSNPVGYSRLGFRQRLDNLLTIYSKTGGHS